MYVVGGLCFSPHLPNQSPFSHLKAAEAHTLRHSVTKQRCVTDVPSNCMPELATEGILTLRSICRLMPLGFGFH